METRVISALEELPDAAELLRSGQIVSVPTETVYGLCVNALDGRAAEELYEIKGRPEVKPLSLMVADSTWIDRFAREVPAAALALSAAFWPGPLTLILPVRKDVVPPVVLAGGDTVGLRCPAHEMTLSLLRLLDLPLAGPSANPSGSPSPKTAAEVLGYFGGKIPAVIDGGACSLGTESTVLDMSVLPYRVVRPGALSEEEIDRVLTGRMRVIGLTGGSGSGKTTVLEYLAGRGALGLDCDAIYHRLLSESRPMLAEISARFPEAFVDGALDRKRLGAIVFADGAALDALSTITHHYVKAEVKRLLRDHARCGGTAAVIDAIALFESGLDELCTETVGVTADPETRIRRIMDREGISEEYARLRISAQKDEQFYRKNCSRVIVNDGSLQQFEDQCRAMFG